MSIWSFCLGGGSLEAADHNGSPPVLWPLIENTPSYKKFRYPEMKALSEPLHPIRRFCCAVCVKCPSIPALTGSLYLIVLHSWLDTVTFIITWLLLKLNFRFQTPNSTYILSNRKRQFWVVGQEFNLKQSYCCLLIYFPWNLSISLHLDCVCWMVWLVDGCWYNRAHFFIFSPPVDWEDKTVLTNLLSRMFFCWWPSADVLVSLTCFWLYD